MYFNIYYYKIQFWQVKSNSGTLWKKWGGLFPNKAIRK